MWSFKQVIPLPFLHGRKGQRQEGKKQNQEIKIHNFVKNWGPERDGWEGGFKVCCPLVLLESSKGIATKRGCLIRALVAGWGGVR